MTRMIIVFKTSDDFRKIEVFRLDASQIVWMTAVSLSNHRSRNC